MAKSKDRPRPKRGLKKKLLLTMLLVGVLPLVIGLTMAYFQGTTEIEEVNGASFQALGIENARKLDLVITEEIAKTRRIAIDPAIIRTLEDRRDASTNLTGDSIQTQLSAEIEQWEQKDPTLRSAITEGNLSNILREHHAGIAGVPGLFIPIVTRSSTRALFITDIDGRVVASLYPDVEYFHGEKAWWQGAFKNGVGQEYMENVFFDQHAGTYTFTLSVPIMDSIRYQAIGVLHRVYDAKEFFAPSIDSIQFGKSGHVMLIDGRGVVMSCPILPTGTRLSDSRLIPLVTPNQPGWVRAPSDGHDGATTSIIGFAPLPSISRITQSSSGQAWHVYVWQSSEELFAPIRHLFTWIAVFGVIAVSLLLILGLLAAGRIVKPIQHLQEATRLIGRGEFQEPLTIKTGDELEDLSEEVNRMNSQLEAAFLGLESQVETKTQEVKNLQETSTRILEAVDTPLIMLNKEGVIQYMNPASMATLGLDREMTEHENLFKAIDIDDYAREQLRSELAERFAPVDEAFSSQPSNVFEEAQKIRDPLLPDFSSMAKKIRKELSVNKRRYQYKLFPVNGNPMEERRILLALRDVTEESHQQDQLIQSEKRGSLGVLSAGIGHELNNPLFAVIGLGEAIQEAQDLTQVKEYAKSIVQNGKRMASTVQDFSGQVRGNINSPVKVNINEQLERALQLIHIESAQNISVDSELHTVPLFPGQPDELRQVFMNVLTNSIQAMGENGTISIATKAGDNQINIKICDSGPGIPTDCLAKIFDPFFTTKGQGEGTGLGLTIARRIVNKYGGTIQIESEEGEGTSCHITLPLTHAPLAQSEV